MKKRLLIALLLPALAFTGFTGMAQEKTPEKSTAASEMHDLIAKVQAKIKDHKTTEADLSDELKQFDKLLAEHKGEQTEDVARILLMKAMLYRQVIKDEAKGDALVAQLEKDFPNSQVAKSMKAQDEAHKISEKLVEGSKFPDFDVKDVTGKPMSIANYKGKVVLVDFWATWCGPCVGELPNVLSAYEKHHGGGFEIVGISLDQDEQKLTSFTKEKNMTWQQFFDGKGWQNSLAQKYGIQSIPATFLLDGEGKIIGKNLRGEALESAVAKALTKS